MKRLALIPTLLALATPATAASDTGPSPRVEKALRLAARTHHVPYWQLRSVSWCESRWNPSAVNGGGSGSTGLFQFLPSTFRRTPYWRRSILDPVANALAAAWLVRQDHGWVEWTCKP